MSGGSYDYAFAKVDEMAERLTNDRDPARVAFGVFLRKVAKAMHDIEWVDSCDYSPGDELAAIKECYDFNINDGAKEFLNRIQDSVKVMEAWLYSKGEK